MRNLNSKISYPLLCTVFFQMHSFQAFIGDKYQTWQSDRTGIMSHQKERKTPISSTSKAFEAASIPHFVSIGFLEILQLCKSLVSANFYNQKEERRKNRTCHKQEAVRSPMTYACMMHNSCTDMHN